jgi:hypothetical protein
MADDIFKSSFTLKFKSEEIEKEFQLTRAQSLKICNLIYTLVILFLSIIFTFVYLQTSYEDDKQRLGEFIKEITYFETGIHSVLFFLSLKFRKISWHKLISHINIYFTMITYLTFRIYLLNFLKSDYFIYTLAFTIQQFFLLTTFYSDYLDFFDGFLLYLSAVLSSFWLFHGIDPSFNCLRLIADGIAVMSTTIMFYYYMYERKRGFYYYYTTNRTIKWYQGLIDNINNRYYREKKTRIFF